MACASCGKRYGNSRQMRAVAQVKQRAQLATQSQVRSTVKTTTEVNKTSSGDLTEAIKKSTEDSPVE